MEVPKFVWVLLFIVTIILSTTTIAYFFNIDTVNYIGYLLWFVALAIFYMILSGEQKSVFVS